MKIQLEYVQDNSCTHNRGLYHKLPLFEHQVDDSISHRTLKITIYTPTHVFNTISIFENICRLLYYQPLLLYIHDLYQSSLKKIILVWCAPFVKCIKMIEGLWTYSGKFRKSTLEISNIVGK